MGRAPARSELHGQETEVRVLAQCCAALREKTVADVGAELGGFSSALREAGYERVWAFEPHPENAARLRERFAADTRVTVSEVAISDRDGQTDLHVARDDADHSIPFSHSLVAFPNAPDVRWPDKIPVPTRSLDSLVRSGELPRRVGVLKSDTEGNEPAVIAGMGALECEIVVVEHWHDLPRTLGRCPWSVDDLLAPLRSRGYHNFAFVTHGEVHDLIQWNTAAAAIGEWGNLLVVHDSVLDRVAPLILGAMAEAQRILRSDIEMYRSAAETRLEALEECDRARRAIREEAAVLRAELTARRKSIPAKLMRRLRAHAKAQ